MTVKRLRKSTWKMENCAALCYKVATMFAEPMTTAPAPISEIHNKQSAGLMILAAVCYSFVPIAVELSGSSANPFLFGMGWRSGISIGFTLFLAVAYPKLFFNAAVWALVARKMFSFNILFVIIAYFDVALFAMSIRYLDVAVSTILAEVSPVFLIFVIWVSYRNSESGKDTKRIDPAMILFMLVGLIGVAFVILSQKGTGAFSTDSTAWLLAFGILLAVGSAIISALNGFSFRWGTDLRDELSNDVIEGSGYNSDSIDLFCATTAGLIATLAVVLLNLIIGVSTGESISAHVLIFVVIGGILTHPIAGIAWRRANLMNHNLGINAIAHMRPILGLLWLLPFSFIVVRGDYLIIGVTAIITANLLINFAAEIRWGFKALLMALGACGTVVYLRDGAFAILGIDQLDWTAGNYFAGVALAATIFTLLLAFRVATLVSRTNEEESRAFSLFRKLDLLAQRGVISGDARECIIRIDAPQNQADLKDAYIEARNYIIGVCPIEDADRQMLNQVEAELDTLARSKQLGLVLGELFALVIFAGITISLALLSRPAEDQVFTRLLVDVFAMLISAVVIFLTVNVWDLHHERGERQLELRSEYGDYVVRFPETERRLADQWLSIIVGAAIVATYVGLLAHKWLGWFG